MELSSPSSEETQLTPWISGRPFGSETVPMKSIISLEMKVASSSGELIMATGSEFFVGAMDTSTPEQLPKNKTEPDKK